MEDLGEPTENFVEFFRCVEKSSTRISQRSSSRPLSLHGNLLASSSLFGYLFVASGSNIIVYKHTTLREDTTTPSERLCTVDFKVHGISSIRSVVLLFDETALAIHGLESNGKRDDLVVASVVSLIHGKAIMLAVPRFSLGVSAFSVKQSPPPRGSNSAPATQQLAVLLQSGAVELHALSAAGTPAPGVPIDSVRLSSEVPTCVSISPDEELVTVGTERGNVFVYDTDTVSLRTTIVAVESGWIPFAVHFAASDAILVSYLQGESVSHVVWTIGEEGGDLCVKGPSPLGELCFASPPPLPSSDDEVDGEDDESKEPSVPAISCCAVPGWNICVVSSSLSTDVEVIALNEDGIWENWKFDEGKSATLPTDANDNDTKALGIAFDLTDTSPLYSADPSAPRINPMPLLLTLTTDLLILPFSLIDDRPGAHCEYIREPAPLPPNDNVESPTERDSFPNFFNSVSCRNSGDGQNQDESTAAADLHSAQKIGKGADPPQVSAQSAGRIPFVSEGKGFAAMAPSAGAYQTAFKPTSTAFGQMQTQNFSDSEDSGTAEGSSGQESGSEAQTSSPLSEIATSSRTPATAFQDAGQFLSNFSFPSVSDAKNIEDTSQPFAAPSTGRSRTINPFAAEASADKGKEVIESSTISSITAPKYPPQPGLEEASAAVSRGKPMDVIRSILLEMQEELIYQREAQKITSARLEELGREISGRVENSTNALVQTLGKMRGFFRDEMSLRNEVLVLLQEVTKLNHDYQTASFDLRVRDGEGVSTTVQAKDRAMDERLARRESEVLRSISSIDERLNADRLPKDNRRSPAEQIQQVYSSLTLQGIRIKKVKNLLLALASRTDELDRGGRRSDLGLSMARLEKLTIRASGSPETRGRRGENEDREGFTGRGSSFLSPAENTAVEVPPAPQDVREVLRRLAMRGGRANICAKATKVGQATSGVLQVGSVSTAFEGKAEDAVVSSDASLAKNVALVPKSTYKSAESTTTLKAGPSFEVGLPLSTTRRAEMPSRPTSTRTVPSSSVSKPAFFPPYEESGSSTTREEPRLSSLHVAGGQGDKVTSAYALYDAARGRTRQQETKTSQATSSVRGLTFPTAEPTDDAVAPALSSLLPSTHARRSQGLSEIGQDSSVSRVEKRLSLGDPPSAQLRTSRPYPALPPDSTRKKASLGIDAASESKPRVSAALPPDKEVSRGLGTSHASGSNLGVGPVKDLAGQPSFEKHMSAASSSKPEFFAALPGAPSNPGRSHSSSGLGDVTKTDAPLVAIETSSATPIARTLPQGLQEASLSSKQPGADTGLSQQPAEQSRSELQTNGSQAKEDGSHTTKDERASSSTPAPSGLFGQNLDPSRSSQRPSPASKVAIQPQSGGDVSQPSFFGPISSQAPVASSSAPLSSSASQSTSATTAGTSLVPEGSSTDDSDREGVNRNATGMDTSSAPPGVTSPFGTSMNASMNGSFGMQVQSEQSGISATPLGTVTASPFGNTTGTQNPFGSVTPDSAQSSGFGVGLAQRAANPTFTTSFSSPFGPNFESGLQQSSAATFGYAGDSQMGGGPQFNATPQVGGSSQFGTPSQLGASFGATSQLGGSPFGTPGGAGSGGFGGGSDGFGVAMPVSKFGESSFGVSQQQPSFGGSSSKGLGGAGGGASPFGSVSEAGFGGQAGGGSGFAALAASQPQAFGSDQAPLFGSSNGPPSFTSAAFAQRRA